MFAMPRVTYIIIMALCYAIYSGHIEHSNREWTRSICGTILNMCFQNRLTIQRMDNNFMWHDYAIGQTHTARHHREY